MTDARTYLAGIKERAEAATAGPWRIWKDNEGSRGAAVETSWAHDTDGADTELITDWCKPADAEFIFASRVDLPRVADALLAVLAECDDMAAQASTEIATVRGIAVILKTVITESLEASL